MRLFGDGTSPSEGENNRVGDEPSFATAGFLAGGNDGTSGGDSGGDSGGFDPAIHVSRDSINADGSYRRKRGRKPGAGNSASTGSRKKADHTASIDALSNILVVLHTGIAGATKTPEIAIDKDDADTLAKATSNVLAEFNIAPDPKVAAVIGLVIAAGSVYGPMAVSIRLRKQAEAKATQDQQYMGM